jgi:hypothetical protein
MQSSTFPARLAVLSFSLAFTATVPTFWPARVFAQAPAPAKATPQRGTVKSIEGGTLTLTTDTGQEVVITVPGTARIQRLAPGSTDLKTAETAALSDIAVGDRVLVTGTAGETPAIFTAVRVILMKSGDIAQKHEAEQQDWQRRGAGGIVDAVDPTGTIRISSGARKLEITTTPGTTYRRYAGGSVRFEDAKPGTLSEIHAGDQLLARGAKSAAGSSVQAEEVVSGSFKNLSGTLLSIDAAKNTVSLKDLVTKRNVMVQLTANSALHRLPAEAAARFAARSKARAPGGPASGGASSSSAAPSRPAAADISSPDSSSLPGSGMGHTGGDLSQIVSRLPAVPLTDFHTGDAVMIVAEQTSADSSNLTAITLLAGVEPILAAAPSGSSAMTLSPWSVGTGSPEGGGQQ